MSKGYSGHFVKLNRIEYGTKGNKFCNGTIESHQRYQAIQYVERLIKNAIPKIRRKINTVTMAYDERTGKIYYGHNKGIELNGTPLNKTLKELLPRQSLNKFPLGNCSECDAINNALNDGANLKDLHIYTIYATKKDIGKPKLACENCTYAFKGKIKSNNSGWSK